MKLLDDFISARDALVQYVHDTAEIEALALSGNRGAELKNQLVKRYQRRSSVVCEYNNAKDALAERLINDALAKRERELIHKQNKQAAIDKISVDKFFDILEYKLVKFGFTPYIPDDYWLFGMQRNIGHHCIKILVCNDRIKIESSHTIYDSSFFSEVLEIPENSKFEFDNLVKVLKFSEERLKSFDKLRG